MEAEFVNEYIARLNANLHDATSKNVMHETRIALLEKALSEANIELEKLRNKNKKAQDPTL
jgi:hypothetical protein